MKHRVSGSRLLVTLGIIIALLGLISWRLFDIGWAHHSVYSQTAQAQANGISNVFLRGNIYLSDQAGTEFLVATNRKFPLLQVFPAKITPDAAQGIITSLSSITGLSAGVIEKAVHTLGATSRVVARKLTDDQVAAIQALKNPGVVIGYETDRSYPAGMLAADVLGFVGYTPDGRQGQYGIESYYDRALSGLSDAASPVRFTLFSQLAHLLGHADPQVSDTGAPHDIILTIDKNIQEYAQSTLDGVLKKFNAASGTLLVQEPTTGRLMAVADSPSFDPNRYGSAPAASFADGALQPFEPGSSFKPFTMAAGLDLNKVTPDTTFDDISDVIVDGYNIKNFNELHFGRVTMTQVLEKSINAGAMWVQQRVGSSAFLDHVINMGFGQRTGIDLSGEASGDISNLYTGRRINFMTASFGQGITVTPLQLINTYSAIANGGKLMKPYLVSAVRDEHGTLVSTLPQVIGTPFTSKTAATLRTMLTSVVDKGFDKARIARYDVAGKTGTAQIASPRGGYLEKQYNHSFVGFAPAADPKFVILIKMEKPQGITFAADSLSPAFRDMALFLLNYLNIPPTR